ncbi:MAG: hypothetical protein AAGA93_17545 [Actinomycetota bacterium]
MSERRRPDEAIDTAIDTATGAAIDDRSAPALADTSHVAVEIEVRPAWAIGGEISPGLAVCLLVAAAGPGWDGPVRVEVTADGRVGPGPATLQLSGLDHPSRRWARATLVAEDGGGRVDASIDTADDGDLAPPPGLNPVERWPEDVPTFHGGRPGAAASYEVRPLPGPDGEPLSADAWVRPFQQEGGVRPNLLAIDAWLAASQIEYLRHHANDPTVDQLPTASWVGGSFALDVGAEPPDGPSWLLRRSATTSRNGSTIEFGAVEAADAGYLRPRVRFELRRPGPGCP